MNELTYKKDGFIEASRLYPWLNQLKLRVDKLEETENIKCELAHVKFELEAMSNLYDEVKADRDLCKAEWEKHVEAWTKGQEILKSVVKERDEYLDALKQVLSDIIQFGEKQKCIDLIKSVLPDDPAPANPLCETCKGKGKVWQSGVHGEPDHPIGKYFPCPNPVCKD